MCYCYTHIHHQENNMPSHFSAALFVFFSIENQALTVQNALGKQSKSWFDPLLVYLPFTKHKQTQRFISQVILDPLKLSISTITLSSLQGSAASLGHPLTSHHLLSHLLKICPLDVISQSCIILTHAHCGAWWRNPDAPCDSYLKALDKSTTFYIEPYL